MYVLWKRGKKLFYKSEKWTFGNNKTSLSHEKNYTKVNDIVNICRHILRTADKKYEKSDEIFTNLI